MDSTKVLVQAAKRTNIRNDQYSHILCIPTILYVRNKQSCRPTDRQGRQKRVTNRPADLQTDSIWVLSRERKNKQIDNPSKFRDTKQFLSGSVYWGLQGKNIDNLFTVREKIRWHLLCQKHICWFKRPIRARLAHFKWPVLFLHHISLNYQKRT
jgi:hypothetical protein